MCGLVGQASSKRFLDTSFLKAQNSTITHRGPDDSGEWWSTDMRVGLAHSRLSIIDLSNGGHQPMTLSDKEMTIVFNGEIYNHHELRRELLNKGYSFKSKSDTEVLLAAYSCWGMECIHKLNGMFSFAIYDHSIKKVFLARDRAGEKPLFYYFDGISLYFASELKALMKHPSLPKKIDMDSLDCYLGMGYAPGKKCILKGYNKLEAAHILSFDLNNSEIKLSKYWELPEYSNINPSPSMEDLSIELEKLLEDSVSRQLEADVPVGILLSGGVDSSLLTALASQKSSKVKTFTISMTGHKDLDETSYARLIANHFGTDHTELPIEESTSDLLPILAKQYDEPMVDSSMIPTYLVSKLVRKHCKVAIGGDGGDELFGGYQHYKRILKMKNRVKYCPTIIRNIVSTTATHLLPPGFKGRNWLQGLSVDFENGTPQIAYYFDHKLRKKLLSNYKNYLSVSEEIRNKFLSTDSDIIQRATKLDFNTYLKDDILVKVDRASMLNSLEIRAPFLDQKVIEFAYKSVPSDFKVTYKSEKILLKYMASKILPKNFDLKRKQGFSIPLGSWLKSGPYRDMFNDVLLSSDSVFDKKVISSLLNGQDMGLNNSERLFSLFMFELWRKEYDCYI